MNAKEKEFTALIEEHQAIIHKITRIYEIQSEERQDLFQEIVYQLWKSYPSFSGASKFTTWMYRVALNTAITIYRSRRITYTSVNDFNFSLKTEDDSEETEEQLRELYKAIQQLNDIDKAIIFLYLENHSGKEIADAIGISEVNVRVRMNRIKTRLKELMTSNE